MCSCIAAVDILQTEVLRVATYRCILTYFREPLAKITFHTEIPNYILYLNVDIFQNNLKIDIYCSIRGLFFCRGAQ
jgi:hypothetical protein